MDPAPRSEDRTPNDPAKLPKLSPSPSTSPSSEPKVTIERILDELNFDRSRLKTDLSIAVAHKEELGFKERDKPDQICNDRDLKLWLSEEYGSVSILIDGNESDIATQSLSFVSVAAASLLKSKKLRPEGAYVLRYFCGLNRAYDNKSYWLADMMNNLNGQVLSLFKKKKLKLDLDYFLDEVLRKLKERKLSTARRAFRKLVLQLPQETTLYCILDHVSLYDYGKTEKDTCKVLNDLVGLVDDERIKSVFKLVLTSPGGRCIIGSHEDRETNLVTVDKVLRIL